MSLLKISELNELIDKRTNLLVLPSIDDLFGDLELSMTNELRIEFYNNALQKWRDQIPLVRLTEIQFFSSPHKFRDTFELYVDGTICIDELEMIPTKVISLNGTIGGMRRGWIYQDHMLYGVGSGKFVMNATYKYPIWYKINPNNELDPRSSIGFISEYRINRFVDACLVEILEYIFNLKNNFQYPSLPVEVMGAVESKYQEVKQSVTDYYTTLSHGRIYR